MWRGEDERASNARDRVAMFSISPLDHHMRYRMNRAAICMAAAALGPTPASAGKLANALANYAAEQEEANRAAAAARDAEMRALIGPNYQSAPEQTLSPDSREAAGNITPQSLKQTQYNGLMAELSGTDRDIGILERAAVGDVVLSRFDYFVRPVYHPDVDFDWSPDASQHYIVPKNTPIGPDQYGDGVCTTERRGMQNGKPKKRVCFRDTDNDLRFDNVSGISKFEDRKSLSQPVPYKIVATSIIASKFRREILYLGRSGDTLRFQYREFATDLIRPAFTTEMTYTLEKAGVTTIRYQSTVINVRSVSNDGIEYIVRS